MNNKHEFAIYYAQLSSDLKINSVLNISDKDLYHRLISVLRLQIDETFILFNKEINVRLQLISISKKEIKIQVVANSLNKKLVPKITVLLSILKREAFEEAIYYCVELGANVIQPVITEKVHFKKWDEKENNRLQRIIIAAAEQSKNFGFPELKEPMTLDNLLKELNPDSLKIFFDASGEKLSTIQDNNEVYLLIGPEGDLTIEEKENLKKSHFLFYKLTPTILRAQTAVGLSLGIFRTFIK